MIFIDPFEHLKVRMVENLKNQNFFLEFEIESILNK